jgi:hypothetical protein
VLILSIVDYCMLQEYQIPKANEVGNHPFFVEFPELLFPYTRQIAFWANRQLMIHQNKIGGTEFALTFMREELEELREAVDEGNIMHVQDEAADVGIVGFIVPALGNGEIWEKVGSDVVAMVTEAREASKLTMAQYADKISAVIDDKNRCNHPAIVYQGVPWITPDEVVKEIYMYSRNEIRTLRYKHPEERLPIEVGTVMRMNGRAKDTKWGNDPFFVEAIAVYARILETRENTLSVV